MSEPQPLTDLTSPSPDEDRLAIVDDEPQPAPTPVTQHVQPLLNAPLSTSVTSSSRTVPPLILRNISLSAQPRFVPVLPSPSTSTAAMNQLRFTQAYRSLASSLSLNASLPRTHILEAATREITSLKLAVEREKQANLSLNLYISYLTAMINLLTSAGQQPHDATNTSCEHSTSQMPSTSIVPSKL